MMNHTRRVFVCLLGLVVILSILVFPVSAQGNDSGAVNIDKNETANYENATSDPHQQNVYDLFIESQRNFDRSLSILDTVATLIGIVVGIFAIVIAIVGGLGFLEIKKWHQMRNNIEEDAEVVRELKTKVEKYADTIRNEAKNIPKTISKEKPTNEMRRELDEYGHRLETLELLGMSLKPEDYINRGNDLFYKDDYESALKAYDKAIELEPDDAYAWYNKGTALGELGWYEEELEAYNKAIELKSDYFEAWSDKGVALGDLGRYEEELEAYDKAIELKPDYANAWFNRACVYARLGNKEKALSDLKKAIELDASNKEDAKKDKDFKNLRDDEDFKKLVK